MPLVSDGFTSGELDQIQRICGGSRLLAELAGGIISMRKVFGDDPEPCVYRSPPEFILRHGRLFDPKPFPAKYRKWRRGLHGCFENALELAVEAGGLAYAEGYALPGVGDLPTAHAWCVDADGCVVDPTWHGVLAGREYCGLPLDIRPLWRSHQRGEPFGLMFNDACLSEVLSGRRDWRKMLPSGASGQSPERRLSS